MGGGRPNRPARAGGRKPRRASRTPAARGGAQGDGPQWQVRPVRAPDARAGDAKVQDRVEDARARMGRDIHVGHAQAAPRHRASHTPCL